MHPRAKYGRRSNGDKVLFITPTELQRADEHSRVDPYHDSTYQALRKEKEVMHEKSLECIKMWENTILGQRKKRLAAQEDRRQIAEKERQQIDIQWQKVKDDERRLAIERARRLQYYETSRIKQLQGRLMMSNVLKEREAQLEYKDRISKLSQQREEEENKKKMEAFQEETKRLQKEELERMAERKEIARFQQDQALSRKEKQLKEKELDVAFYAEWNHKQQEEAEKMDREQKEKLRQNQKALKEQFLTSIEKKKNYKQNEHKEWNEEDSKREKYISKREQLDSKTNHVIQNNLTKREKLLEAVSKQKSLLSIKAEEKLNEFLEKHTRGDINIGDMEKVIMQKRKEFQKEVQQYREERSKEEVDKKKKEQEQEQELRKILEDESRQFFVSNKEMYAIQKKRNAELRDIHLKQMEENRQRKLAQKKDIYTQQLATLNLLDQQDDEFEQYSLNLIKEWQQQGRDIRPLVRELNQDYCKRKLREQKGANTFERLGFTMY